MFSAKKQRFSKLICVANLFGVFPFHISICCWFIFFLSFLFLVVFDVSPLNFHLFVVFVQFEAGVNMDFMI